MNTIRWYSAYGEPAGSEFVRSSLGELASWLKQASIGVEVTFVQVPAADGEVLEALLAAKTLIQDQDAVTWQEDLTLELAKLNQARQGVSSPGRMLLYCPDHSPLREAIQLEENSAGWGAQRGWLSMVWRSRNKQLVWHETLHLLGARDCYDTGHPHSQPKCLLNHRCLMQFAPCPEACGETPVLCADNIALIRADP